MNPNSLRLSYRHISAALALAVMTLAVLPALSGCKPNSNGVDASRNGQTGAPSASAGERRAAPPERPELLIDLIDAILAGNEQAAIELVEQGAPIHGVNDRGVSMLHLASRATMPKLTRRLLEYGAEVDVTIDGAIQPIHWASRAGASNRKGAEETIDVLLEYGADINARTEVGNTLPITYALLQPGGVNERWRDFMISRGSLTE